MIDCPFVSSSFVVVVDDDGGTDSVVGGGVACFDSAWVVSFGWVSVLVGGGCSTDGVEGSGVEDDDATDNDSWCVDADVGELRNGFGSPLWV